MKRLLKKILVSIFAILINLMFCNEIVLMKYDTKLPTYLKYSQKLSEDEKEYLKAKGSINLGSDITAPPISYFDNSSLQKAHLFRWA